MKTKKTIEARNLLIAMSLGDGHINKAGRMILSHGPKQLEYLKWKAEKLNEVGIRTGKLTEYQYKDSGYLQYIIRVSTNNFCKVLRRIMYRPHKVITNRKLLNRINALGLAIWYMDDGSISKKKRSDGTIRGITVAIHTCFPTIEEALYICNYFKEEWKVEFHPHIEHGKYYSICCGTQEGMHFFDIIKPYVEQCPQMRYKIQYNFMYGKQRVCLCSDEDVAKRREIETTLPSLMERRSKFKI